MFLFDLLAVIAFSAAIVSLVQAIRLLSKRPQGNKP